MRIAYSPVYIYEVPEGHRFPMIKYELLPQQLMHEGTATKDQFFHPDKLTRSELLSTHSLEFLNKLDNQELTKKEIRKIGFPMSEALVERGKHIAKGTYLCAKFAQEDGVSLNIAGGTHHSFADHGEGFCVFNDIAIASNLMLERNEAKSILIVDLDVHQGNGTASIFSNESRVFTFSMHGVKNYPARKEISNLDIPLIDNTTDQIYLDTLANTLPDLIQKQRPDMIFYLSGVDPLATDKLGRLGMTVNGLKERDRFVFESCYRSGIPVAVAMGGGYSEEIKTIIEAHANTFRTALEIYT